MPDISTTRLAEIAGIVAVALSIVGSLLVYTARVNDRIAILEERVLNLQHQGEKLDAISMPLVDARLERQRADLDDLNKRLEKYCRPN